MRDVSCKSMLHIPTACTKRHKPSKMQGRVRMIKASILIGIERTQGCRTLSIRQDSVLAELTLLSFFPPRAEPLWEARQSVGARMARYLSIVDSQFCLYHKLARRSIALTKPSIPLKHVDYGCPCAAVLVSQAPEAIELG
jgi:hypothetical protein